MPHSGVESAEITPHLETAISAVFKQEARKLIDQLPDAAGWGDLAEKARFLEGVERGMEAADRGDFASTERVRAIFAKRGVDVEG